MLSLLNARTRTDCTRDMKQVKLPYSAGNHVGFNTWIVKPGYWFSTEDGGAGRMICRVVCEGKDYIEAAIISDDLSSAYIRWIEAKDIRTARRVPPKSVLEFMCRDDWSPESVHSALNYGVSDMNDQLPAYEATLD